VREGGTPGGHDRVLQVGPVCTQDAPQAGRGETCRRSPWIASAFQMLSVKAHLSSTLELCARRLSRADHTFPRRGGARPHAHGKDVPSVPARGTASSRPTRSLATPGKASGRVSAIQLPVTLECVSEQPLHASCCTACSLGGGAARRAMPTCKRAALSARRGGRAERKGRKRLCDAPNGTCSSRRPAASGGPSTPPLYGPTPTARQG
jgi:hypothetical protein